MTTPAEKTTEPPAKLEQKEYVVAFLDFLGASEKMKSPKESDDFLQKINVVFNDALAQKDYENNNKIIEMGDVIIKIFSDNIVIARECYHDYEFNECFTISRFCARLQGYALYYGLLLRGAITIGKLYIDDKFVFGEALVRAYKLESTLAVYPRIIMSDEVANVIALPASTKEANKLAVRDFDGIWFLNFMHLFIYGVEKQTAIGYLVSARRKILDLFHPMPFLIPAEKRQKYYWLAAKFNQLCERFGYEEQKIAFDALIGPEVAHFYEDEYKPIIKR